MADVNTSATPEIVVYTAATMNGWKPLIMLEELGVPYDLVPIDFDEREQTSDWFLQINPNGRIPAIVDRSAGDFAVFESGAVLWYLAEKYGRLLPADPLLRSEVMQWLMFQVGGVGPMMGQAMYFQRIAAPQGHTDDFAIERYVAESRRLLEVVDGRLRGRDWLVGDELTIADIALYPYARSYPWARVSIDGLPNLQAWFGRMEQRPGVRRGVQLPEPFPAFFGLQDDGRSEAANAARFAHDVRRKE